MKDASGLTKRKGKSVDAEPKQQSSGTNAGGDDIGGGAKRKTTRSGCSVGCYCYYHLSLILFTLTAMFGHIAYKAVTEGSDGWGGVPRSLDDETAMCPVWIQNGLRTKLHYTMRIYRFTHSKVYDPKDMLFHQSWAGDYTCIFSGMGQALLKFYAPRHADSVKVPIVSGSPPQVAVGSVVAPDRDIDDPVYWPLENLVPRFLFWRLFPTLFNCFMGTIRDFDFDDLNSDNISNVWTNLVKPGWRKQDFFMSYYNGHTLWDGKTPMYPALENDFSVFLKADTWEDGLEKAIAFDLIGAHRIEQTKKEFRGEQLAFVLPLNQYNKLEVRPNFAKYGGDMYFSAEGLPVLIITPDGQEIQRGDKDWQYWKFAWRSTLLSIITLIDHLHLTHYRTANLLATVSRRSLPADHPSRRLISIFTFGSIWINNIASHLLIGHNSPLHRATPFTEFEKLSTIVPHDMKSIDEWHAPLLDPAEWEKLPQMIKETAYFADGKLLITQIRNMVDKMFFAVNTNNRFCSPASNYSVEDPHLIRYLNDFMAFENVQGYHRTKHVYLTDCRDMHQGIVGFLWTVTGWHRHVGMVADYFRDPDLAGFSWKEGEAFVRPKQATLMGVVAAVTGTPHPKLLEDFSHVFDGIVGGERMAQIWREFQEDLRGVEAEIVKRNEKRAIKNFHAAPSVVECSVAV